MSQPPPRRSPAPPARNNNTAPPGRPPPPRAARPSPPRPPSSLPRVPLSQSHFDENHLPSVLHRPGPMTPEAERQARRRTCRFIEEAGQRALRLPRVAVATATVFFHRFYSKHAFQEHDRFEVAVACLLLAGKTEESPKKLDFIVRECWKLRRRAQQQQQQQHQQQQGGGISPGASPVALPPPSAADRGQLDPKSEECVRLKERVLLLERVILHTIGFELSIDHPYKFLVDAVQNMNKKRTIEGRDGQPLSKHPKLVQELAQNGMNFANDSMHSTLCLQYTAREIAMACVYLSGKYTGVRPAAGRSWIDLLDGIAPEDLINISLQILELVQPKKGLESETALKRIRKDMDEMAREGGGAPEAKRPKVT